MACGSEHPKWSCPAASCGASTVIGLCPRMTTTCEQTPRSVHSNAMLWQRCCGHGHNHDHDHDRHDDCCDHHGHGHEHDHNRHCDDDDGGHDDGDDHDRHHRHHDFKLPPAARMITTTTSARADETTQDSGILALGDSHPRGQ